MGLFLPVLLLGLVPPADQPTTDAVRQPNAQMQTNAVSAPASLETQTPANRRSEQRMDRIEPFLDKPITGREVCLTIRSYYFEREDALAPELKGMTTCENAREVRERNIKTGQKPRLVPATRGQ